MILIQKREDSLEIWYKFLIYPEYIILLFREIEIEDLKEKRQYFFKANRWLAVEKGDGKVSCNLTPTKDEEISVSFFYQLCCMHIDCFWSRRRLDRGLGKYQDNEIWKYFTPRLHTIAFLQLFYILCKKKNMYVKRVKGGKKYYESFSAWTGKERSAWHFHDKFHSTVIMIVLLFYRKTPVICFSPNWDEIFWMVTFGSRWWVVLHEVSSPDVKGCP